MSRKKIDEFELGIVFPEAETELDKWGAPAPEAPVTVKTELVTVTAVIGNQLLYSIDGYGYSASIQSKEDWMRRGSTVTAEYDGVPGTASYVFKGFKVRG